MLTTLDERDYVKLLEEVKRACLGIHQISPEDIFNDIVLQCLEEESEIYIGQLRNKLLKEVKLVAFGKKGQLNGNKIYLSNHTYVCGLCNEGLPAAAFSFVFRKATGHKEILYYCIECQRKYAKERRERIKHLADYKMKNNERRNKWKAKKKKENPAKFKAAEKERHKRWMADPKNKQRAKDNWKAWYLKNRAKHQNSIDLIKSDTP